MQKDNDLPSMSSDQEVVQKELSQRLTDSNIKGSLDFKMTTRGGKKSSSSTDKMWVLNNVLRLHNVGATETKVFSV